MATAWLALVLIFSVLKSHVVVGVQYRVTTVIDAPYVTKSGDGKYEGFVIDILDRASELMNFTYTIEPNRENQYGTLKRTGNWTGMIGDLVHNEMDIAAAVITASHIRSVAVSFSQPFLETGLRILVKSPPSWHSTENLFAICSPMSRGVWATSCILSLVVVCALCCIGRFSPWEGQGSGDGIFTLDTQGTTLANSFRFVFAGWTAQGCSPVPRSISGRALALSWWIFSLFFLALYASNLVAFFITKEPALNRLPFTSFESMIQQNAIEFGYLGSSSTEKHFRYGALAVEKNVWAKTRNRPDLLVSSYAEGIQRVRDRDGSYAMIMEGAAAEHAARHPPCDLSVVGAGRGERMYSFACRVDSVCSVLDEALLKMKTADDLHDFKRRWFTGGCETEGNEEEVEYGNAYVAAAADRGRFEDKGVSLYRFGPGLLLFFIGVLLSVVSFAGELVWVKYFRKPIPSRLADEH